MSWGAPSVPLKDVSFQGSQPQQPTFQANSGGGSFSSSAPPTSSFEGYNAPNLLQLNQQKATAEDRLAYITQNGLYSSGGGGGGGTSAADRAAMQSLLDQGFDIQGRQINTQGQQLGVQGQQLDLKALGIGLQQQGQDINAQKLGLQQQGLGVDQRYLQSLGADYATERGTAQQNYESQNRQDLNAYNSAKRQQLDAAAAGGSYTSSGTRAGLGELSDVRNEADIQNLVGRFGLTNHLLSIGQNERQNQGDIIKNKLAQQGISLDLSQNGLNKQDLANQLKGIDLEKVANSLSLQDVQALRDQLAVDRQKAALTNSQSGGSGGGGSKISGADIQAMWGLEDQLTNIMDQKAALTGQNAQGSQYLPGAGSSPPVSPDGSAIYNNGGL